MRYLSTSVDPSAAERPVWFSMSTLNQDDLPEHRTCLSAGEQQELPIACHVCGFSSRSGLSGLPVLPWQFDKSLCRWPCGVTGIFGIRHGIC